jgi:hypothetical protein
MLVFFFVYITTTPVVIAILSSLFRLTRQDIASFLAETDWKNQYTTEAGKFTRWGHGGEVPT